MLRGGLLDGQHRSDAPRALPHDRHPLRVRLGVVRGGCRRRRPRSRRTANGRCTAATGSPHRSACGRWPWPPGRSAAARTRHRWAGVDPSRRGSRAPSSVRWRSPGWHRSTGFRRGLHPAAISWRRSKIEWRSSVTTRVTSWRSCPICSCWAGSGRGRREVVDQVAERCDVLGHPVVHLAGDPLALLAHRVVPHAPEQQRGLQLYGVPAEPAHGARGPGPSRCSAACPGPARRSSRRWRSAGWRRGARAASSLRTPSTWPTATPAQAIAPGWVPTEYRSGAIEPLAERTNTPALRVGTTLSASSMICSAMPTASRPPLSLPDSASSRLIRPTALR